MPLVWSDPDCPTPPQVWVAGTADPVDRTVIWPLDMGCCESWTPGPGEPPLTPEQQQFQLSLQAAASQLLYEKLRCFNFRTCYTEIAPCVDICGCRRRGCCGRNCDRRQLDLAAIVGHPIINIDTITITPETGPAVVVPAADYWLDRKRYLVPVPGGLLDTWPEQDVQQPPLGPGTWTVGLFYGNLPPQMALIAAADLACQLWRACNNQPCDIPPNAVSVTREGMTINLLTGLESIPTIKMLLEVYKCDRKVARMYDPAGPLYPAGRVL